MIRRIDQDLAEDYAAVIQIASTGEALIERRLAEIPTEEWNDACVDTTLQARGLSSGTASPSSAAKPSPAAMS